MKKFPRWLQDLQGLSIIEAIEVLGRECRPRRVIAVGRPCWDTLDALCGIATVEAIETYNNYKDPSRIYAGWKGEGDAVRFPITRPSRAVTLSSKICWINPAPGSWSQTCNLAVLAKDDFPFDQATLDTIGDFIDRTAIDAFVSLGNWNGNFPPASFFIVELDGGHCGIRSDRVTQNKRTNPNGAKSEHERELTLE
jgi:hypothetical protein